MTTDDLEPRATAPPTMPAPRPMFWSVRRELWENRSLYIVPAVVGAIAFFGFIISAIGLPQRRRAVLLLGDAKARAAVTMPYDAIGVMLIFIAFFVGAFYCLDALYGERRDRSILFWKSLPVSDMTSVLAKMSIPLAVLPAITFVTTVIVQMLMLAWTTTLLITHGMSPASTVQYFHPFTHSFMLLYGLIVIALWHAPIYAWLLFVSSWARRAPILWAILPIAAAGIFEQIAFRTLLVPFAMKYRLFSGVLEAFAPAADGRIDTLAQLTPGNFLATSGLWIGLAFAAVFLFAAARLRRDREPI